MKTIEDIIIIFDGKIDHQMLKNYIDRDWVRPNLSEGELAFEDIDIARLNLVRHLIEDMQVNDEGVDISLSLLDQLYGLREKMRKLTFAIAQQPHHIQTDILLLVESHGPSVDRVNDARIVEEIISP